MANNDQTLVIGLGRFGRALAETLGQLGHEVMGVDASAQIVQDCAPTMTHVVQADSTDAEALRQLGAADFGRRVVAIGSDIQASILTTYALVDLDIPRIWAKAITAEHGAILERVGAHRVIFPERDMGVRVAHSMVGPDDRLHRDRRELRPHRDHGAARDRRQDAGGRRRCASATTSPSSA